MSDDRSVVRSAFASRRRFLRGIAGLSLVGMSSVGSSACNQGPGAGPRARRLPLIAYFYISSAQYQSDTGSLLAGLEAQGYQEGRTIWIEWRQADSDPERWPATAQELIDLRPAVIVLEGRVLVPLLLKMTSTIPIVAVLPQVGVESLIEAGWIKSQARPGGNLTGLVGSRSTLPGKRLDLLHETVPGVTRLATLRDPVGADPFDRIRSGRATYSPLAFRGLKILTLPSCSSSKRGRSCSLSPRHRVGAVCFSSWTRWLSRRAGTGCRRSAISTTFPERRPDELCGRPDRPLQRNRTLRRQDS